MERDDDHLTGCPQPQPDPKSDPDPKAKRPGVRGWNRLMLRDLAEDRLTNRQIAVKYGKSVQTVNNFATFHREDIQDLRDLIDADANDRLADSVAADKDNRIRMHEEMIKELDGRITDDMPIADLTRISDKISKHLNAIAEEKNELPTRVKFERPREGVTVVVERENGSERRTEIR
jgi:hypothetical protein